MDEGLGVRSGVNGEIVVKNRNSSGCLIVRKKVDGVGSLGFSNLNQLKEKKRPRLAFSESESSEELEVSPSQRRISSDAIRECNGLTLSDNGEIGSRKRNRLNHVNGNEDGAIIPSANDGAEMRSMSDVFESVEYDGEKMRRESNGDSGIKIGGRGYLGSIPVCRSGGNREFGTGLSRDIDRDSSLNSWDYADRHRFEMRKDVGRFPVSLREKCRGHSAELIRLQGKNGVLKVMVNKNKAGRLLMSHYNWKAEESGKNHAGPLKNHRGNGVNRSGSTSEDTINMNVIMHPPLQSETNPSDKPRSFDRTKTDKLNLQKKLSAKNYERGSEDIDVTLKLGSNNVTAQNSIERISCEGDKTASTEKLMPPQTKEKKLKRGSGTEKQKLRERIREMLVSAGWKIDYRPRRNRDYLDAVYINPIGTAYWSITKAYDALQKQLDHEDSKTKLSGDCSSFTLISDDVRGQLTRKTRKKMEREMMKQRDGDGIENPREASIGKVSNTNLDLEVTDSDDSHKEK